jgi:hypothetical protein
VEAAARSGTMLTGRLALRGRVRLAAVTGSRGAATLIAAGARSLPADNPERFAAGLHTLLDPTKDRATACTDTAWPEHLAWLRTALQRHGERGATASALGDPIAGAVALTEAEALGLVAEVVPGRWAAVQ